MFEIPSWLLSFMLYSLIWIVLQWLGFAYFWGANNLGQLNINTRERASLYILINGTAIVSLILVAMRFG